jgi:hypothetical protein
MAACGYFDKRRFKKEQQLNANSTASQSFSSGETNPWLFQSDSTKLRSARAIETFRTKRALAETK